MEMNYDTKELHELERELDVEILPGTEIMRDVGSHKFKKSGEKVLVPQPSDHPEDPLNWSVAWKTSTFVAANFVTFWQGFGPLSLAPQFPLYMKEFDISLEEAVQFTGVTILVLGFSNFIWVPISTSFGRRPVYLMSMLVSIGAAIWRATATSYSSFMGACVLNGIASGPGETIQPAVIADIFFLHHRGAAATCYWVVYMGSLMVAPIISGPMSDHVGWRSFWWFYTGGTILTFIMVFFMFPETKWHRMHHEELDRLVGGPTHKIASQELEKANSQRLENGEVEKSASADSSGETTANGTGFNHVGRGKPGKQQWKLYQPNPNPWRTILYDLWIPWKLFAFPIIEFAAFVISFSCSSFLVVNLTQSQALAAPPYNFSPQAVGFTNFAVLVGALIGLATAGPLSDWVAARATRKNNGIREPEMRLVAMIPYTIIMLIGNIVVSVGYDRKWPWEVIVIIGYSCAGIQVAALPAFVNTYAIDSYRPVAGSLMVMATVNKNVYGYGVSKYLTPWAVKSGFIPPIMTNAALITFFCLFGILFHYYGKTFRRMSKNSSVHNM